MPAHCGAAEGLYNWWGSSCVSLEVKAWVCFLIHFFLLNNRNADTGGVIQQMWDEPRGFLLQGLSLSILLTKLVLEPSPRWPCLWKGKGLPGLLVVFSKGPAAAGGPGGAAFAPEQFEVCINSPVRLRACWIPRQEHTSLCLSVLTGVSPSVGWEPSAGCCVFFPILPPALTSVCQAFQTARYGSAMI